MKKQMIGIAMILLGILFGVASDALYGYTTMILGVFIGVIGLIIVIAYARDKQEKD